MNPTDNPFTPGTIFFKSAGFVRLKIFGFYLALLTFMYLALVLWYALRSGHSFKATLTGFSFLFSLFLILLVLLPLAWLIRKKYVKVMAIDKEKKIITLVYSRNYSMELQLVDLAFIYYPNTSYDVLVLYNKITATRGHLIYAEADSLIGFAIPCGWSKAQIRDISLLLEREGIEKHLGPKKGFIDRVFL